MKTYLLSIRSLAPMLLIMLCGMAGCRNSGDDHGHAVAEQLFLKSVRLIELYTDSIRNVSDSASYRRMRDDFDEKLAKVNFQFPADTDLKLTQEENDSLVKMLDRFVALVREKEKMINATDSVSNDSIPVKKNLSKSGNALPSAKQAL